MDGPGATASAVGQTTSSANKRLVGSRRPHSPSSLEEVGYNRAAGFVWLRLTQSGGATHTFDTIGKQVWYAGEVTAFVEQMHGVAGVKSKELLIWVTISEIVLSPSGTKIIFRTPAGLGRALPVTAFQLNLASDPEKKDADAAN
uniref:Uncharacterized protein n=1 Tax=Oryza meridionalis TaxID=40149 RepID=A0A0E0D9C9_9ORYZ